MKQLAANLINPTSERRSKRVASTCHAIAKQAPYYILPRVLKFVSITLTSKPPQSCSEQAHVKILEWHYGERRAHHRHTRLRDRRAPPKKCSEVLISIIIGGFGCGRKRPRRRSHWMEIVEIWCVSCSFLKCCKICVNAQNV